MRPVELVLSKLPSARRVKENEWKAKCPAHRDGTPSLTVSVGEGGRALVHCFGNCSKEAIVSAMGLTMRDLMPTVEQTTAFNPTRAGHTPRSHLQVVKATPVESSAAVADEPQGKPVWKETARYDYTDAMGAVVFTVVRRHDERTGKKSFFQVQPNGVTGLTGIAARPLYHLPAVRAAVASGAPVLLVEGEKDVHTAEQLGWVATTNCGGSGGWKPEYAAALSGADVVILPDNDGPGREWAAKVATSVVDVAKLVRCVALPGLPEKGDLTDWVERGGTATALHGLVARAKPWVAGDPIPEAVERSRFALIRADALQQLPPLRWLVDGVLPSDGLAALVGPSGKGKTFLTIGLAGAVATGQSWLGCATGDAAPVLYIAAEGTAGLKQRVAAWVSFHKAPADLPVYFICETVNLMTVEDVAHVTAAISAMPVPPALVVVDTLHRAMVGGDENSAKDVGIVVQHADAIRRFCGCTVLVVHHNKKDADVERGSTALRGACDAMLMLRDDEDSRTLICEKQKDGDNFAPITLEFVPHAGSLVVRPFRAGRAKERTADPLNLTINERQALSALIEADTGDGMTATEWQKTSGVVERTFHRVNGALMRANLVQKLSPGRRFRVTYAGRQALETAMTTATGTATKTGETAMALPKLKNSPEYRGGAPFRGAHTPLSYGENGTMAGGSGGRSGKDRSAGPDGPPSWVTEWRDYEQDGAA